MTPTRLSVLAPIALLTAATATAQIPDGWYVFGGFGGAGQTGIFASHPRTPGQPTVITNLQGDLTVTGSSCVRYRQSDDTVLVGERAPVGGSVDLHVIRLDGSQVLSDHSFSLGQGGSCCGEIPQMAILPDGRVVVAVTDIASGPLMNYLTSSFGYQGLGIVDTQTGLVSPITVTNGATILDVFNGLALSPDATEVFVGTYVSSTQGDIYSVPIGGGTATLVATVPAGLSNLGFDGDGNLMVTTLNATASLFRVDVGTGAVTAVPTNAGALNGIRHDEWTDNFALVSSSGGSPGRSIFWLEPDGTEHLLDSPGFATPSGVDIKPAHRIYGTPNPTSVATYDWALPNPTGLPVLGNADFALVESSEGPELPGILLAATGVLETPISILGFDFHLDPATVIAELPLELPGLQFSLPIPNDPALAGVRLYMQAFHLIASEVAATSGLGFTIH